MNHKIIDDVVVERPTREDIYGLRVGDMALNPFGRYAPVTRIYAQKDDINGKAFVCYYTTLGTGAAVSNTAQEGEVTATLPVLQKYKQVRLVPTF